MKRDGDGAFAGCATIRRGEAISRLPIYRASVGGGIPRVFLYLTPEGLVADIDVTDGLEAEAAGIHA